MVAGGREAFRLIREPLVALLRRRHLNRPRLHNTLLQLRALLRLHALLELRALLRLRALLELRALLRLPGSLLGLDRLVGLRW